MNSKILSLLLASILAAWMAPPLGAQGVQPSTVDAGSGALSESEFDAEEAEERLKMELYEKRMAASALLNMTAAPTGADVDTNESENDVRAFAEQAVMDDDPVVAYYGAAALALLDGRALPAPPSEFGEEKAPIEIPAGVSFTEPSDWEAFLIHTSALRSESVDDRLQAVNGLINLGSVTGPTPAPEVVFTLAELLADEDPQVAQFAARALASLVPSDDRHHNTKALGRLATEAELFALVDASLGDGGESPDQRLQAMEALLEAAMQTPLAEDPEVLRAFETSATDADPRIAYWAQLALHGGLAGDPNALAGTWVAPVDPYAQAESIEGYFDQPPSPYDDAPVEKLVIEAEGNVTGVYVNPEPQPFDPSDQPPSPTEQKELATYEEVAPNVWVNTAPLPPVSGEQEQLVESQ